MDAKNAFFDFVETATTPYHCTKAGVELLREAGFTVLDAAEDWQIVPGGKYAVVFQDLYILIHSRYRPSLLLASFYRPGGSCFGTADTHP